MLDQVNESARAMVDIQEEHHLVSVSNNCTSIIGDLFIDLFTGIVCRQLQNPRNGVVTQKRIPYVGSVAVYTCNENFELNSNSKRVCQSNGLYSGSAPVCEGESCCAV